ncbi:MAG: DNA alkylation repair protein [Verrucomicrobia bacterium]|nr:DNA alkylation repair protein [Verrucomicrobiota bacterium]
MAKWTEQLEGLFSKQADPASAQKQSAYLLDQFPFFGLPKPKRAELQKELFNQYSHITRPELIEAVRSLWNKPQRELHYAALDLLVKHWKKLEPSDLCFLEELIRTNAWWDTVDSLAANVLGKLVLHQRDLLSEMDRWIDDEFLWVRRTALIFQLKWKKETEEERLFAYCEKRLHENNFFIRKGIGWALREYSKSAPDSVSKFLSLHSSHMSRLSYKEASRLLPPA